MTLKDQMAKDVAIFLNTGEHADVITYNGVEIPAVADIGQTNSKGNIVSNDGYSDRAIFELAVSDVHDPQSGDEIVHDGKTWHVVRLEYTDGFIQGVSCVTGESAYGR